MMITPIREPNSAAGRPTTAPVMFAPEIMVRMKPKKSRIRPGKSLFFIIVQLIGLVLYKIC